MSIGTRQPRRDESETLRHIWAKVFGDGDESSFFDYYFDPELCIVGTHSGIPVSAGYLVPAGNLVFGKASVPCAMIYAVATLPEYRNLGLGAAVVDKLVLTGQSAGFTAVVLCPSSDGLFEFYSTHSVFRDWFFIRELLFCGSLPKCPAVTIDEVLPREYYRIREDYLSGVAHIEYDERALSYQSTLSKEFGGGLFRVITSRGVFCAVVERQRDNSIWIKELLAPEEQLPVVVAAIASLFPAKEYSVRVLARLCDLRASPAKYSGARRFGMLAALPSLMSEVSVWHSFIAAPWYGLAFD